MMFTGLVVIVDVEPDVEEACKTAETQGTAGNDDTEPSPRRTRSNSRGDKERDEEEGRSEEPAKQRKRSESTGSSPPPTKRIRPSSKGKLPQKKPRCSIVLLYEPPRPQAKKTTKTILKPRMPAASEARLDEVRELLAAPPKPLQGDKVSLPTAPTPTTTEAMPSPTVDAETRAELADLRAIVLELKAAVDAAKSSQAAPRTIITPAQDQATEIEVTRTLPNAKVELPPAHLRNLCAAMLPVESKVKSQYQPLPVHSLAAHRMFKDLSLPAVTSKYSSPTAFVLALRDIDCRRLSGRGASVMMFRECPELNLLKKGSSNANYVLDFGSSVLLPPSPSCYSYDDLLDAIHGLTTMANEVWYDHMRMILSRLRTFVSKNKSADPIQLPVRVDLTRIYADKVMGLAMGAIQSESEKWWQEYHDVLRSIDYHAPAWSLALVNTLQDSTAIVQIFQSYP
ncbi:TPA: hypothetical protein N0F65_007395 [Lagenidium giganteum]|uniref:Uncharacterized protein n=1 Tax=Lagenidium giganteum TaxID=4803 RepID=A0AAV2ZCP5_9STRA|nr:TPA: hypothetical protein N0F65_007395 [Lagenidium giganteum]